MAFKMKYKGSSPYPMKSPMKINEENIQEEEKPKRVPPTEPTNPEREWGPKNPMPPNPVANLREGPTQPDGTQTWFHPELGLVDRSGNKYTPPKRRNPDEPTMVGPEIGVNRPR